jgi:hypothetical protein
MKTTIMFLIALLCAMSAACSSARYTVKQGGLSVEGETSSDGEHATMTASKAYANATLADAEADAIRVDADSRHVYADAYANAVKNGNVYPYQGGGYGNELSYYYNGLAPAAGARASTTGGEVTQQDLAAVRKTADDANARATDSLKMQKRLRQELESDASSH